jgi:hypothetical protein
MFARTTGANVMTTKKSSFTGGRRAAPPISKFKRALPKTAAACVKFPTVSKGSVFTVSDQTDQSTAPPTLSSTMVEPPLVDIPIEDTPLVLRRTSSWEHIR